MGENGAGKSTLIKVLTGLYQPDAGELETNGVSFIPRSPKEAYEHGISAVYQEVNLIPSLSVAENIVLGRRPSRWGLLSRNAMRKRASTALAKLGVDIDIDQPLGTYSISIQQVVAIARAVDTNARVLILDEPTSSLDQEEVERLFTVMRGLRSEGMALVFISHFLEQVYAIADRMTILRNGKVVGEGLVDEIPRLKLISMMMGRSTEEVDTLLHQHIQTQEASSGPPVIELKNLARSRCVGPVNFELREGEVTGLAGLLGSGRTETARMLFGVDPATSGTIELDGKHFRIQHPRDAIGAGIALNPEDRKDEGCFPNLSLRENIIIALQARKGVLRRISDAEQTTLAQEAIETLQVVTSGIEQPIGQLSGGNQQKALLARWLILNPRLFILDEPTRGIDVGSKAEIEKLIARLCKEGMSLLLISSELEEVVRNSNKVVVLKDRKQLGILQDEGNSETAIMNLLASEEHA